MAKRLEEKHQRILRQLIQQPHNNICIECSAKCPTFANLFNFSFLCTRCSGLVREFGHRVKSISASTFTPEEIKSLQDGGNQICKQIWLATYRPSEMRQPVESDGVTELKDWIRTKYVMKKWYSPAAAQSALTANSNIQASSNLSLSSNTSNFTANTANTINFGNASGLQQPPSAFPVVQFPVSAATSASVFSIPSATTTASTIHTSNSRRRSSGGAHNNTDLMFATTSPAAAVMSKQPAFNAPVANTLTRPPIQQQQHRPALINLLDGDDIESPVPSNQATLKASQGVFTQGNINSNQSAPIQSTGNKYENLRGLFETTSNTETTQPPSQAFPSNPSLVPSGESVFNNYQQRNVAHVFPQQQQFINQQASQQFINQQAFQQQQQQFIPQPQMMLSKQQQNPFYANNNNNNPFLSGSGTPIPANNSIPQVVQQQPTQINSNSNPFLVSSSNTGNTNPFGAYGGTGGRGQNPFSNSSNNPFA